MSVPPEQARPLTVKLKLNEPGRFDRLITLYVAGDILPKVELAVRGSVQDQDTISGKTQMSRPAVGRERSETSPSEEVL
jgi:hypothetical protein